MASNYSCPPERSLPAISGSAHRRTAHHLYKIAVVSLALFVAPAKVSTQQPHSRSIPLNQCSVPNVPEPVLCGAYSVLENPANAAGRRLSLQIVILPARNKSPQPDPILYLSGGPGETNTELAPPLWRWAGRDDRDIVLIDARGTSRQNRLDCKLPGSETNLQVYLTTLFPFDPFMACRDELAKVADLRYYTTALTVDDFENIRRALGYGQVNLMASSAGTRQALVWLRRYPESVRAAVIDGVVPTGIVHFLEHARSSQDAFDSLMAECGRQPKCAKAYPDSRAQLNDIRQRLIAKPASVSLVHPVTKQTVDVELGWNQFAEALRVMMYSPDLAVRIPSLLARAYRGDYAQFAMMAIRSNQGLRSSVRLGLNLSVACAEDAPLVRPGDVEAKTRNTFLGDSRAKEELAICAKWPSLPPPPGFDAPARASVPVLILSGNADPTTPPRFAELAAKTLPRSRHIVFKGSHGQDNPCGLSLMIQFFASASIDRLDTSCVRDLRFPEFIVE